MQTLQAILADSPLLNETQQPSPPSPAETSRPTSSEALPNAWIERLFTRLSAMYGSKFAGMWAGADVTEVKRAWATGLAGYTAQELAAGLEACLAMAWPPTLPEFMRACRPPLEYETMFIHAAHGKFSPLTYWAAQRFGIYELRTKSYQYAEKRWKECIAQVQAWDEIPPIPETSRMALPAPGKTYSPEKARAAMEEIRKILGKDSPASPTSC